MIAHQDERDTGGERAQEPEPAGEHQPVRDTRQVGPRRGERHETRKNDPIFTSAGALAYKRDLPDCEVHLLDTGHFPLEEDAAATADLVMSFLDRRLLPDPTAS